MLPPSRLELADRLAPTTGGKTPRLVLDNWPELAVPGPLNSTLR